MMQEEREMRQRQTERNRQTEKQKNMKGTTRKQVFCLRTQDYRGCFGQRKAHETTLQAERVD